MIASAHPIRLKEGLSLSTRSPLPADAAAMLEFLRVLYRESYRNMASTGERFEKMTEGEEAKILGEFEAAPDKFMIAAWSGNTVVGNIGVFGLGGEYSRRSARLGMGILGSHQNLGLGGELIRRALSIAREGGFHRIELTVRTFNSPAIHLYEKSGFVRVGLLRDAAWIDGEYCDELLYELLLG